jgi:hypothetical protein
VLQTQLSKLKSTSEHIKVKDLTALCASTLGERYLYGTAPLETLLQNSYDVFTSVALTEAERCASGYSVLAVVSGLLTFYVCSDLRTVVDAERFQRMQIDSEEELNQVRTTRGL